jgi:hypothetical protein
MNHLRGIMLLIAGCFALYQGWKLRAGHLAFYACGLGLLAIALGLWRLTRHSGRL